MTPQPMLETMSFPSSEELIPVTLTVLAVVCTLWCVAALVCLAETQSPAEVVDHVLSLPNDVLMPLTV